MDRFVNKDVVCRKSGWKQKKNKVKNAEKSKEVKNREKVTILKTGLLMIKALINRKQLFTSKMYLMKFGQRRT